MGSQSRIYPSRTISSLRQIVQGLCLLCCVLFVPQTQGQTVTPTQAQTTPLSRPRGLAFDAAGNLYIAEETGNRILRMTPAATVSSIAGNGVQGYRGDGGPAVGAELDGPTEIALDASGNLYLADSNNHCIRRIDASSASISTVVSNVAPAGLAFDAVGNLLYADDQTHTLHRFSLQTGIDRVVAGNGTQGSDGNAGPAASATLDAPYGLAIGANGDLFLTDAHAADLRRITAQNGTIGSLVVTPVGTGLRGLAIDSAGLAYFSTGTRQQVQQVTAAGQLKVIAGTGVQGFSGDGAQATLATLNDPTDLSISPAGLLTFSDTGNNRVRQIDAQGILRTIAGVGAVGASQLVLSGPTVVLYGTGQLAASLQTSSASGVVTLLESSDTAAPVQVGSQTLAANAVTFPLGALAAGGHRLFAVYGGDATHASTASPVVSLAVTPTTLTVVPNAVSLLYGQAVPVLTGTVAGLLPQDATTLTVQYSSGAATLSSPGAYPITAMTAGSAAGNYTLSVQPASVTIARAPVVATLVSPGQSQAQAHIASTTSGLPQGLVSLLEGTTLVGSGSLNASGDVVFSTAALNAGTHTLTASYAGDANFLSGASLPLQITVSPAGQPDFALTVAGASTVSVLAGSTAQFAFSAAPINGTLSSPILLSASGLPAGATASFNPAYLPPSNGASAFVLTIQTPHAALATPHLPYWFALLVPCALLLRKRRLRGLAALLVCALLPLGCGDRVHSAAESESATKTYTITVTGTATQTSGATLVHTTTVTLQVL